MQVSMIHIYGILDAGCIRSRTRYSRQIHASDFSLPQRFVLSRTKIRLEALRKLYGTGKQCTGKQWKAFGHVGINILLELSYTGVISNEQWKGRKLENSIETHCQRTSGGRAVKKHIGSDKMMAACFIKTLEKKQ